MGLLVGGERQPAAVALLPQLEQRGREQGQPAGLAGDVLHEPGHEAGLDDEAGLPCGRLDRARELAALHRVDNTLFSPSRHGDAAPRGPLVIRAHGSTNTTRPVVALRGVDEAIDVLDSLVVVALSRENLLELVHGQTIVQAEPVERALQVRDRVSTGRTTTRRQLSLPGSTPSLRAGSDPPARSTICRCRSAD